MTEKKEVKDMDNRDDCQVKSDILHSTEGHDAEISGAIFGCLLLEQ